ncbi:NAD(P)H-binding protein [Nocardioides sp. dk4132]|uniref:NAD(P)-dependent oxidoreductase n=1 Tax=unclassified Nocardioides TaxID=2615069 RepID=UPI0012976647|nr:MULTISPECIES: NAD(P)H-binding protein [unclassified Nocardioides]MQW76676.1 NAD(P)H-binding protein [Nocardioides sp. dk4132]QGA06963.1 NAD(P)H-binding protein [Nocardioides sp. dk884]
MRTQQVAVLGAESALGRLVVDRLRAEAHQPRPLTSYDEETLRAALAGADVVISVLTPPDDPEAPSLTEVTGRVLEAMRACGVRRYVGLGSVAVRWWRDEPTARALVLPRLARLRSRTAQADLAAMTELVSSAEVEWTLARVVRTSDGPSRGTIRSGYLGLDAVRWSMTRTDLATFLVEQVIDETYLRAAPVVTN